MPLCFRPLRFHRLIRAGVGVWLAGLLLASGRAAEKDYDYYLTGNPGDAHPAHTRGSLLLYGGGEENDDAFRWFVQAAGGGDIVVLRAAQKDGYNDYLYRQIGGVDSVETIVFHNRAAANDARVLEIISRADGIFLAGGDQAKYVNYWKGTPVAAALDAHVRAGKPLGGTSAGLAVMGEFAYAALAPGDLTSAIALGNPLDPRITLETDFLHLDLLKGLITDSHFTARDRLGRSLVFLAQLASQRPPGARLAGLGLDEKTALCVEADGTARVVTTDPKGRVWLLVPTALPEPLVHHRPLTFHAIQVIALGSQSSLQLPSLKFSGAESVNTVSVANGNLSPNP